MPKAPVLSRTLLWETLSDGTIHLLDWFLVQTSLGTMVESRTLTRQSGSGSMVDEDCVDGSYTNLQMMTAETLYASYNVGGSQWPHYRLNDRGVQ